MMKIMRNLDLSETITTLQASIEDINCIANNEEKTFHLAKKL